jgi:hypothetical protein
MWFLNRLKKIQILQGRHKTVVTDIKYCTTVIKEAKKRKSDRYVLRA